MNNKQLIIGALKQIVSRWEIVPHYAEPNEEDVQVLRVQDSQGRGPFLNRDEWIDPNKEGHISPFEDSGFEAGIEQMISEAQDADEGQLLYGFENEKQMKDYFSENELIKMQKLGFKPEWVDADYVWYGKHQVIFEPKDWRSG